MFLGDHQYQIANIAKTVSKPPPTAITAGILLLHLGKITAIAPYPCSSRLTVAFLRLDRGVVLYTPVGFNLRNVVLNREALA